MSLAFIARGHGLSEPSARLSRATLLALLADLVWYEFVGFCLGLGCWVGVTMIASGLQNFRRCRALRLEGMSQVGVIPFCVPWKGRTMPCRTTVQNMLHNLCLCKLHPDTTLDPYTKWEEFLSCLLLQLEVTWLAAWSLDLVCFEVCPSPQRLSSHPRSLPSV